MINTTPRLRAFQLALVASAAVGLSACSKTDTDPRYAAMLPLFGTRTPGH